MSAARSRLAREKAAGVGWMDFAARIDNNCLNQALVEPPLWRARDGFETNERQRSIPFVESHAPASSSMAYLHPPGAAYSEHPLHALGVPLEAQAWPRLLPIHPLGFCLSLSHPPPPIPSRTPSPSFHSVTSALLALVRDYQSWTPTPSFSRMV